MMQPGAIGAIGRVGLRAGGSEPNPLALASWLLFDRQGNLSPLVTSGHTTTGTYFDATGTLQTAAAGVPRVSYDPANLSAPPFLLAEEARTNSIRNNTMQGAVAGVIGSGGSMPTNWNAAGVPGTLTRTVVGVGVESGVAYVDIRFAGTTSSGGTGWYYDAANQVPAIAGNVFSHSVFVSVVGGSLNNVNAVNLITVERSLAGTGLITRTTTIAPTSVLRRYLQVSTLTFADVAFAQPGISLNFSTGVAIDITLRIGLPELSQGVIQPWSPPILTFGSAVTRSADNVTVPNLAATGFNAAGSTLYLKGELSEPLSAGRVLIGVRDASDAFGAGAYVSRESTSYQLGPSSAPLNINSVVITASTSVSVAAVLRQNDSRLAVNGALGGLDQSCEVVANPTALSLGNRVWSGNGNAMNGRIYQAAIIPTRISDSGLQRMTRI